MFRIPAYVALVAAFGLCSCFDSSPSSDPAGQDESTAQNENAAAPAPDTLGSATGDTAAAAVTPAVAKDAVTAADTTPAAAKDATAEADGILGAAKDALSEASAAGEELSDVGELSALLDPKVLITGFKETISKLDADTLKDLGQKLITAIQSEQGLLAALKEKLSGTGISDLAGLAGGEGSTLKADVEQKLSLISGLKEKLGSVVEALESKGIDVSKFTGFLNS